MKRLVLHHRFFFPSFYVAKLADDAYQLGAIPAAMQWSSQAGILVFHATTCRIRFQD